MNRYFFFLNIIHIFNDGYKASFLLLLPFIAKDFHLSLTMVGVLALIVNMSTTILALPSGYLSGKFGGIRILILSLIVYSLGFIFTGFTKSIFFFPITFFVTGIGFGTFHTIGFALVAKYSNPEKRGKTMGEFSAYGELGRVGLTALISFIAGLLSWQFAAISFGVVAFFAGLFGYNLKLGKHEEKLNASMPKSEPIRFRHLLKDNQFILANLTGIFDTFASGSLTIFLPFLLIARRVPLYWLGLFAAMFFIGAVGSKTILGRLIDKYGNEKIFVLSELGMAFFILILTNIPSLIGIVIACAVLGAFTKGTSPITQTMVSKTLEKHGNFEKGFALNNLTLSVASFLGPVALGFFADHFGIFSAFNVSAIFAVLAIVPAIGLRWVVKRTKAENVILETIE